MPVGIAAMKRFWILAVAAAVTGATAFATLAIGLDRSALWQVVRACVADYQLTGAPFPCLEVNLSGGEERGNVVLRPPLLRDLILAPTREIIGVEDPSLLSPDVPNYFDAAWRARGYLKGADGRAPERDEIALVANSANVRVQDQLHIHIGCLRPYARRVLESLAPKVPIGKWVRIGAVTFHSVFWATRVEGDDLSEVEPFRLAVAALADKIKDRSELTIVTTGARVEDKDGFLLLASYASAKGSWWPVGADDLMDRRCLH
jgi:CDP-diacylglycerol pyrophosphatase